MSGINAFAVLGSVTGGRCVALQWCRLDRNVPYILSNLFVGQQKSNRFRRYDAWKSALVHYWPTGGSYAMVIANLGFFSMNIRGFIKWAASQES
jgi:hypothetical protein